MRLWYGINDWDDMVLLSIAGGGLLVFTINVIILTYYAWRQQ